MEFVENLRIAVVNNYERFLLKTCQQCLQLLLLVVVARGPNW